MHDKLSLKTTVEHLSLPHPDKSKAPWHRRTAQTKSPDRSSVISVLCASDLIPHQKKALQSCRPAAGQIWENPRRPI
uniref:Peptidylprolyl isomerase n=1 Tax=Oryza glumipatula TaxID=40148 RepID=A0A0D9ZLD4_9ORYZ